MGKGNKSAGTAVTIRIDKNHGIFDQAEMTGWLSSLTGFMGFLESQTTIKSVKLPTLSSVLEQSSGFLNGTSSSESKGDVLEYNISVDMLWINWTTAKLLEKWFHANNDKTPANLMEIELRTGGKLFYSVIDCKDDKRHPALCQFSTVIPSEKLTFIWGAATGFGQARSAELKIDLSFSSRGDQSAAVAVQISNLSGRMVSPSLRHSWIEGCSKMGQV